MPTKIPVWDAADFEAPPANDLDATEVRAEKTGVLYVRVSVTAHRAVKAFAAQEGLSIEQFMRRAVNDYLARNGRDPVA